MTPDSAAHEALRASRRLLRASPVHTDGSGADADGGCGSRRPRSRSTRLRPTTTRRKARDDRPGVRLQRARLSGCRSNPFLPDLSAAMWHRRPDSREAAQGFTRGASSRLAHLQSLHVGVCGLAVPAHGLEHQRLVVQGAGVDSVGLPEVVVHLVH